MSRPRLDFSILLIFSFFIISCAKKTEFDSLRYISGGFGVDDYHFILDHNRTFTLKVGFNPLNEDSTNVGTYKGKISSEEMLQIQKAVTEVMKDGYDYHDPELVLDAGIYEVGINIGKSMRTYKTDNATENFRNDVINPLNKICEKISRKK